MPLNEADAGTVIAALHSASLSIDICKAEIAKFSAELDKIKAQLNKILYDVRD